MALTDILFDNEVMYEANRGNVGVITDVTFAGASPITDDVVGFSGGGLAIRISPEVLVHLQDENGKYVDKPIFVIGK